MFARVSSFVRAALRRGRFEAGMRDELRFHIEAYADDLVRAGVPRAEARRRARLEFGGIESIKEECREGRGLRLIDEARQDLRYGLRMMAKTPVLTAAAILSLGLGIGANTAIFSLIDAVLFRTLPLERPDRLYFLAHDPGPGVSTSSNYPLFERYRTAPVFSGVTAARGWTFRVTTVDGVEPVPGQFVSGNYHEVLGVPMTMGRGFSSEPDRRAVASLVAVISHDFWTSRFGRRPDVIGKTLAVDGRTVSIVGVTASGFHGLSTGERVDITLPMSVMALDTPEFFDAHDGWIGLLIVGRLAAGVDERGALAATDLLFQQFVEEPENRWVRATGSEPHRSAALVPAARGTWSLRRQYSRPLWVLMAMVGLVLIISCANVANLLLARATARTREIAVRLSIGAGRFRVVRQLLVESLLLAICGGGIGVFVAIWGTDVILRLVAIGPSPMNLQAGVNAHVLGFTTVVVVLTGIGFGLAPAFGATRLELAATLNTGGMSGLGAGRPALGKTLVVAQVALCVVLVAAAGLLSQSLANLQGFDAGFDRDNILLADVDTTATSLDLAGKMRFYSDLSGRLRTRPGVLTVALSTRSPIDFSSQVRRIDVAGVPPTRGQGVSTNVVTPGYFQAFGLRLIRGRDFTEDDRQGRPSVAVVSVSMAQFYFGGSDPLGRTFVLGGTKEQTTIVGVVQDARHEFLRTVTPPKMVYTPLVQIGTGFGGATWVAAQLTLAVRTSHDPAEIATGVRADVRALSKDAMVPYLRTMTQQIDASIVPERLMATLSEWFAGVAVVLACVGLYGVMSFNVARRSREIGIRMALGAYPRGVLYGVLRDTLVVSSTGIVAGLLITLAATRTVSTFLFGLTPRDPATLAGTIGLLLAVATLAGFLPARHAASVDPVRALRSE